MNLKQFFLLCFSVFMGCAHSLPADHLTSVAYRDMQRLITIEEAAGWTIDRFEVDKILPHALLSLCQISSAHREGLLTWLENEMKRHGGPVEKVYREKGRSGISELLELFRIHLVVEKAHEIAEQSCPIWLQADEHFSGRQISDNRWFFSGGGGGKLILVSQNNVDDVYAGGGGRIMFGRNFGAHWATLIGSEFGGNASFPKNDLGERGALTFGFDTVIPLVLRYRWVNTFLELETGYLYRFTEGQEPSASGVHFGIAFGGRATLQRWFFPGVVFGVSYEQTFNEQDIYSLKTIKLGFRGVLDLDL